MGYFISRAVVHVITCWRIESYGGRFWTKKNVLLPFRTFFLPVEYKGGIILTKVCERMSWEEPKEVVCIYRYSPHILMALIYVSVSTRHGFCIENLKIDPSASSRKPQWSSKWLKIYLLIFNLDMVDKLGDSLIYWSF